jgi:hypothetical protein
MNDNLIWAFAAGLFMLVFGVAFLVDIRQLRREREENHDD